MKKTTPIFLRLLLLLSAAGLSFAAQAGGIALGATRVIYPQGVNKPPCRLLIPLTVMFF
ncbi:fimbrial chaperone [Salmonella enterica subsp. arizonae]|nr:fimbrial chaperone [Salmonella enterica subsp. arizonae]